MGEEPIQVEQFLRHGVLGDRSNRQGVPSVLLAERRQRKGQIYPTAA